MRSCANALHACADCSVRGATKRELLYELPFVLLLQLMRFAPGASRGSVQKDNQFVRFETTLQCAAPQPMQHTA